MDAKVGSLSVEDKPIMSTRVKPLYVNKLFTADKGSLSPGLIVAEDSTNKAVPAVVVTDSDMTGTVNSSNKDFTFAQGGSICPKSVVITHGAQEIKDDGFGHLYGDGSGTVNYVTGAVAVTFDTAPDTGAPKIDLASDPYGVLCGSVITTTGDTQDDSGEVAVMGSAIIANISMSGGSAPSVAVLERLRAKGVYSE